MKWILIIISYGFWDGSITRTEVGYYSTKQECEAAEAKLLRSIKKVYVCAEEKRNDQ